MKFLLTLGLCLGILLGKAQCDHYIKEALIPNSFGHAISACSDGGNIIAGVLEDGPHGNEDWLISRRNNQEVEIWTKAIGTNLVESGKNLIVTEMSDGFLVAGYQTPTNSLTRTFIFVKLNPDGDILWQKLIPGAFSDGDTPRDILITENHIYIAGTSRSYGAGLSDAIILCLDLSGNLLWGKTMGGILNDHFYAINHHSNGKVIIAGNNESFDEIVHHNWVLVMDSLGNTIHEKIIYGDAIDTVFKIEKNNTGNFSLVGYSKSFGSTHEATEVIELDEELNILNDFIIDSPFVDQGFDIILDDGYQFIVSNSRLSPNQRVIQLYDLNNIVNNEIASQFYSINGSIYNESVSMLTHYNNDHLTVICTIQEAGVRSLGLLKFSLNDCVDNDLDCRESQLTEVIDVSFNTIDYEGVKINFNLLQNASLSAQDFEISFFYHCPTVECEGEYSFNTNEFCSNSLVEIDLESTFEDEQEIDSISWQILGNSSENTEINFEIGNENAFNVYCEITTIDGLCTYIIDSLIIVPPPEMVDLEIAINSCEEFIVEDYSLPFCLLPLAQEISENTVLTCQEGCTLYELSIEVVQNLPFVADTIQAIICPGETFIFDLNSIDSSLYFVETNQSFIELTSLGWSVLNISNGLCEDNIAFFIDIPNYPNLPIESYTVCELPFNPEIDPSYELLLDGEMVNPSQLNTAGTYNYTFTNYCDTLEGYFVLNLIDLPPLSNSIILCEGDNFVLDLIDLNAYSAENQGSTELIFEPESSTSIELILIDLNSACPFHLELNFNVITEPQIQLPSDTLLCSGETLIISVPDTYSIFLNDSLHNSPLELSESADITIITENDCFSIEQSLSVLYADCEYEFCDLYFPNAITTNDDQRNDVFYGKTTCHLKEFQLQIFNRWGEKIFETVSINETWPSVGDDIPIGLYVWQVKYLRSNAIEPVLLRGHVTVIE